MIRVECPTGCPGYVRRPWGRRAEPVRCVNCTAWFRAPAALEDGSVCGGELVAAPGARPPAPRAQRGQARARPGRRSLAAHVGLLAVLAVALVAGGAGSTLAAAAVAYAVGAARA